MPIALAVTENNEELVRALLSRDVDDENKCIRLYCAVSDNKKNLAAILLWRLKRNEHTRSLPQVIGCGLEFHVAHGD